MNNSTATNPMLPIVTQRMTEMFGVPAIDEWYDEQFLYPEDKDLRGNKILVKSMMSDVQEMIVRGLHEEARHTLNRAKWVLSNKV
jgi:hypothetical protein